MLEVLSKALAEMRRDMIIEMLNSGKASGAIVPCPESTIVDMVDHAVSEAYRAMMEATKRSEQVAGLDGASVIRSIALKVLCTEAQAMDSLLQELIQGIGKDELHRHAREAGIIQ
jgi:hypothetical protein